MAAMLVGFGLSLMMLAGTAADPLADKAIPELPRAELLAALQAAEQVIVFSLDPARDTHIDNRCQGHCYWNWTVLGHGVLETDRGRATVIDELSAWLESDSTTTAACFNPRHGVRVHAAGEVYDFVVCFECLDTWVYRDGKRIGTVHADRSPAAWDRLLVMLGLAATDPYSP